MPRRDPNQQDEHEPLLPLHTHRPPTAEQSQASASSTPPSQSSISLNATPTSPIIPAAVSLGTASKGKLQARRYLSTSPDSAKRPLLPQHADGAGVVDEEESWSGSGLDAPTDAGSSGIGAQASAQPTPRPAPNGQVRMSEKARGKQRARTISNPDTTEGHLEGHHAEYKEGDGGYGSSAERNAGHSPSTHADKDEKRRGRSVTVIFANEGPEGGKVDVWVEEGESVGMVKDRIRHLHPPLLTRQLRLIHSGRLLTDGVLLLPWLRSLEERVRRQAKGMGGEVEEVLREVGVGLDMDLRGGKGGVGGGGVGGDRAGLGSGEALGGGAGRNEGGARGGGGADGERRERARGEGSGEKVFLHCTVGGVMGEKKVEQGDEDDAPAPRRRGFDTLLDAGLSPADVANMRRQFYESRGEEVPDGLERDDLDDEHARALEEQWIEGDMTADTATTTSEGQYSSILTGLLTGFLYPLLPILFFREMPLPNFFEAEAEANGALYGGDDDDTSSSVGGGSNAGERADAGERARVRGIRAAGGVGRLGGSAMVGTEVVVSSVFEARVQMGVFLGLVINIIFGALRFLN